VVVRSPGHFRLRRIGLILCGHRTAWQRTGQVLPDRPTARYAAKTHNGARGKRGEVEEGQGRAYGEVPVRVTLKVRPSIGREAIALNVPSLGGLKRNS
jgi:hypothetical protein